MSRDNLWCEKYRPKEFKDYVFHNTQYEMVFRQMVEREELPHLLFSGTPGAGKSTLVYVLLHELQVDTQFDLLIINASDENSVDIIREKIKAFISVRPVGNYKYVLLEEGDYISKNGQAALRSMIEEYSHASRFLITCNYPERLLPAIKSRCQHFHLDHFKKEEIVNYIEHILQAEDIQYNIEDIRRCVSQRYPDIRKIVNTVQQYTVNGLLTLPLITDLENNEDWILLLQSDDWEKLRLSIIKTTLQEEWMSVYQFIYQNLDKSLKFSTIAKWEEGVVVIADYLYKHSIVADPEINFSAMMIKLKSL